MTPTATSSVGGSPNSKLQNHQQQQQQQQQQLEQQQQLLWPCVGIAIPRVVFVSLFHMFQAGLFERVRRLQLLKGCITPVTDTESMTKPSSSSKLWNRYQKELLKLLSSSNSSNGAPSSSHRSAVSSPPWNQDALLLLVQQHPQVCKVTYDYFSHSQELKKTKAMMTNEAEDADDEEEDDDQDSSEQHTFADHKQATPSTTTPATSSWGQYPLWRILQMTPLPSLQLLKTVYQAHPAAILQTDPLGNTILHSLCSHREHSHSHSHHSNNSNNSNNTNTSTTLLLDVMRYLLKQEPLLVQMASTSSGATPLHVAVRFGTNMDVVQLLTEAYPAALTTTTLASNETPLHWACQNTHLSFVSAVVPYLLQQQQQHDFQNSSDTTSSNNNLLMATNQRGESCLHILLQHHRQASPTSSSSSSRHVRASTRMLISVLQIMLDQPDATTTTTTTTTLKCNNLLSLPDVLGRVPLHLALSFGCYPLEVIQFLVQQQPQTLWVRDLSGFTPVHRACLYPAHLETLQYVLQVKLNSTTTTTTTTRNTMSSSSMTLSSTSSSNMVGGGGEPSITKKHVDGSDDDDSTKRTASVTTTSSTPPSSPSSSLNSSPTRSTVKITSTIMAGELQAPIDSQDSVDTDDAGHSQVDNVVVDDDDMVKEHVQPPPPPPPTTSSNVSSIFRATTASAPSSSSSSLPTPLLRLPTLSGALPLHVACEFWTSLAVVQTLVEQDRQALGLVDEQGCTPLHLACASRAPYDLLHYLVQQYPKALLMADHQGRLPMHVTLETIPQRGHSLHPPSSTVVELMLGRELLLLLGQEEDRDMDMDDDESSNDESTARHDSIREAKTLQGESGFDIATRHHAPGHILALLVPGGNFEGMIDHDDIFPQAMDKYYGDQNHSPPVQQIHVPTSTEISVPMSWQDDWMLGDDTAGHDWEDLYQRVEI